MERQLQQLGLNSRYQRQEGIVGLDKSVEIDSPLQPGELGCWLSHVLVLRRHTNKSHVHMLEDDAVLHPSLIPVFESFLAQHNPDQWDLLYTDVVVPHDVGNFKFLHQQYQAYQQHGQIQFLELHHVPYAAATSYFVNAASVAKVLDLLGEGHLETTPYDIKLRKLVNAGGLSAYVTFPFVTTLSDHSDDSGIKREDISWMAFNLYRRSFYVDADWLALLDRFTRLAGRAKPDKHTEIYFRLLETMISPGFREF